MELVIDLPSDIASAAEDIARRAGLSTEELVVRALRHELVEVPGALLEEMRIWDQASEEDLAAFNLREGLG